MADIKAADVAKLRKQTGAGMMDCKKALIEANGDFDVAITVLRKKGQKVAAKRADRDATEGIAITKINTENNGHHTNIFSINLKQMADSTSQPFIGHYFKLTTEVIE